MNDLETKENENVLNGQNIEEKSASKPPSDGSDPQIESDDNQEKPQKCHKSKQEKKKRREEKKRIVTTAKVILFTELLGSCLVILYMFLFYAKIYISKQKGSIAYVVLYIFSDVLFMSSWVTSFAALVLRNDCCINYCSYSLGVNVVIKLIALIVYSVTADESQEIPLSKLIIALTVVMIFFSIMYIYLYCYMKRRWSFIPPDRWQRKFNPNLRELDIKKTSSNINNNQEMVGDLEQQKLPIQ